MVGQRHRSRKRGRGRPPRRGHSKILLVGFVIFLLVDLSLVAYVMRNR